MVWRRVYLVLGYFALRTVAQDPEAIWSQIVPSRNLTWISCYNDAMQCARFEVPLDYQYPEGPQAAIALLKVPSSVSSDDASYRGPVLFNPGGPGGSGVDYILEIGTLASQILGQEYDLIGFDPRGVSRSTPRLNIFGTRAEETTFTTQSFDDPALGTVPNAVGRRVARYQSFGGLAKARASDVAPYVSTPLVARDMLAIVRAHGMDTLSYLGVSYGSVLGMTFATMFPQHVGRIVVDGVVIAEDYYNTEWQTNLLDTDKVMSLFYESCHQAGPNACPLFESTPESIQARVDRLLDRLNTAPSAVIVTSNPGPLDHGIVDYFLVKTVLLLYLYNPYSGIGPRLASALAALDNGDSLPFWSLLNDSHLIQECASGNDTTRAQSNAEGIDPIMCTDGVPVNDTLAQYQAWYDHNAQTSTFASVWEMRIRCSGWKIRPVEQFQGLVGANTSFPLLFVSNTLDPVTPLSGAKLMQSRFPGSALLVQDAGGHTSFSATSACTYQALRSYFRDGVLPKAGTICNIEDSIFSTNSSTSARRQSLDPLLDVYRQFTRKSQSLSAGHGLVTRGRHMKLS